MCDRSGCSIQSEVRDPCRTGAVRPRCKPYRSAREVEVRDPFRIGARPFEVRDPFRTPPSVRGARSVSDWSSETEVQDRTGQPANSRCEIRSELGRGRSRCEIRSNRLLQSEVLDPCRTEAVRPTVLVSLQIRGARSVPNCRRGRPRCVNRAGCLLPSRGARFVWDWSCETVVQVPNRSTREITVRDPF